MGQKKKDEVSVGEDVEKKEHLFTLRGNVDWYSHCGKQYESSSKCYLKKSLPYDPAIPLPVVYWKKMKSLSQRDVCNAHVHYSIIHNNQEMKTT